MIACLRSCGVLRCCCLVGGFEALRRQPLWQALSIVIPVIYFLWALCTLEEIDGKGFGSSRTYYFLVLHDLTFPTEVGQLSTTYIWATVAVCFTFVVVTVFQLRVLTVSWTHIGRLIRLFGLSCKLEHRIPSLHKGARNCLMNMCFNDCFALFFNYEYEHVGN